VLLGCGLLAALYLLAITRWRRRLGGATEPFERWRVASFLSGLFVVVISLNGPLHDLSDRYLFSTHMAQHLLLAQIFPPLFLLGLPGWLVRGLLEPRLVRAAWARLAGVPTGFVLYTTIFSLWHVPGLYELMMRVHNIHIVMHLMVMATAVLMWWPIIGAEGIPRPLSDGARLLYLFLLGIPMMAVAAFVTLADHPLYDWYVLAPRPWGMTALEDQKLGGLLMWVPGGMFWWGVMTIVWFRWAARDARATDDPLIAPS
jgi:putative membrane protein